MLRIVRGVTNGRSQARLLKHQTALDGLTFTRNFGRLRHGPENRQATISKHSAIQEGNTFPKEKGYFSTFRLSDGFSKRNALAETTRGSVENSNGPQREARCSALPLGSDVYKATGPGCGSNADVSATKFDFTEMLC
jgi:hypothetical protein